MVAEDFTGIGRRSFMGGASIAAIVAISGCASLPAFSLTEAIRRLLSVSSYNAINRLMAPGGFWDNQLAQLALPEILGNRGGVVQSILSSDLFRTRLRRELNHIAERVGGNLFALEISEASAMTLLIFFLADAGVTADACQKKLGHKSGDCT